MNRRQMAVTFLLVMALGPVVLGQGPGGRRGGGPGGRGGFGMTPLNLLGIEAVQKELELVDAQKEEIGKLTESMRGQRGGPGGPGGGANFQDMTDEERQAWMQERQKRAAEQQAKAKQELAGILLDEQQKRLQEIYIQVAGTQALNDDDVAAALTLTDDQKAQMQAARDEANAQRRELFNSDDREAAFEKMAELTKQADEKILALLNADQQAKFAEMKGKPFDMPADALRGGRGGFGGGRGNRGSGNTN